MSVQHGYAASTGVNLLAANYGKPQDGRGGSGIYAADGKNPEMYVADSASTKFVVRELASIKTRHDVTMCLTRVKSSLV